MDRQSNGEIIDLNALSLRLGEEFQEWVNLNSITPVPMFYFTETGPDAGRPRFGVSEIPGKNIVNIEPLNFDVAAAIILREVVSRYFPPLCLVDVVYDAINRFCGHFLSVHVRNPPENFNSLKWQELIGSHTRRYFVHYMGKPIVMDFQVPGGSTGYINLFRDILLKFRQFGDSILPDQISDIFVAIVWPILNSEWFIHYTSKDVEFATLLSNYMANNNAYPTATHLAGAKLGFSLKQCKDAMRRLDKDPISPTFLHNPAVLGLEFCWVLLETAPAISNYIVRQLTFLPSSTMSFSQCVGTPLPTYLNLYLIPPVQLEEFSSFLADLKKRGILLDYQIFRGEKSVDLLNFSKILYTPTSSPTTSMLSMVNFDFKKDTPHRAKLTSQWQRSWVIQRILPLFGLRKFVTRAMTNFDQNRNYTAFLGVIEDGAFLSTINFEKDLELVISLLERFRNVEYVLRLIDIAVDLLRYLFDHPTKLGQGSQDFGKLDLMWAFFPARDWLLRLFRENSGAANKQADILSQLAITARVLSFFAPYSLPQEVPVMDFFRDRHKEIVALLKADLAQIPADEHSRFHYFIELHNDIVRDRLIIPKISLSPFFHPTTEDFFIFTRSNLTWDEISSGFASKIAANVQECFLLQFSDQSGAMVVGGLIRASHAQFQVIRRKLVGLKGIFGSDAKILVGRRVPSWDYMRRNFTETYDLINQRYAPIGEYLSHIRAELFPGSEKSRKSPFPYTRKILSEPYQGPVEQTPRAPPNLVKLTPRIVSGLKMSFLSGTPVLHNLVGRRLQVRRSWDLNWPAYGLERYFLHVFLSTRQPKYIYTHLITPATRRVLVSAGVSGFQTVLLEYLWPKEAPDDKFLQYLYSRTEKNVLAYSVHRVLSDTRFFNLDKVGNQEDIQKIDAIDLEMLMQTRLNDPSRKNTNEFIYGGEKKHDPGSVGWEIARKCFSSSNSQHQNPPDSLPLFEMDPRTVGFSEKIALIFRGQFDALPLCQSLPFGHYYQTEEIYYSTTERLINQPGHIILFDFPVMRVGQLNAFLDDILRNPAVTAHFASSFLLEQNLAFVQGVALSRVNPLCCNPYDFLGGHYIHLPKRQMREGKWHTLSLLDQMHKLNETWSNNKD